MLASSVQSVVACNVAAPRVCTLIVLCVCVCVSPHAILAVRAITTNTAPYQVTLNGSIDYGH